MNDELLGWILVIGIGAPSLVWFIWKFITDEDVRYAVIITAGVLIITLFVYGLALLGVIEK